MTVKAKKETLDFQAEVKQLLDLVAHSLYGKKEIFLRELVSNASDAADKLRFAALSDNALYEGNSELKIHIDLDEKARTITVKDNGIGMSKDEVIENLGTIAKSGTREFIANLSGKDAQDSNLIGQFGVGFYSAFIVADKVTVKTRKAGTAAEEAVCWESNGEGAYTLEAIDKPERGTEVILHLRKDEDEFLSDWRLREIVTKYSDHIGWPVVMKKKVTPEVEEGQEDKKPAEPIIEEETVNRAKALWTLAKREIKDEEYREFYKHVGHDFEDPMAWSHNHVEGKQHYITLLYIPSRAPFDLWNREFQHGLKLYVKRVFIMDKADQFLPRYLRFVSGVVDSADLPLNISREILQENELVDNIRAACSKRVLSVLEKMADKEPEKYVKFWQEFGLVLKEGPIEDFANRETIAKLLRFASTQTDEETQTVSLADYLSRMQKGQEQIYYITAESFNAARHSPHLEIFRKKNIEVLLLSDPIDEWLVNHLTEFEGKKLQSVAKGELDLKGVGEEKKSEEGTAKQKKQAEETFASVLEQVKEVLGDRIKEVRLTDRLTTSPACVVADTQDMGREMQRILQAAGQDVPLSKPIFELNSEHPIILKLQQETDDDRFKEWTHILFDQALLAEGGRLDDPAQFVQRLNKMLVALAD